MNQEGGQDLQGGTQVPQQAEAVAPVGPSKTSGLAIAALILGLIGLLCAPTAIVGLILGLVALSKIKKSEGRLSGSGLAVAGATLSVLFIALNVVWIYVGVTSVRKVARRTLCLNNVMQIGRVMQEYADDHKDKYPDSFAVLLKEGYLPSAWLLACPSKGGYGGRGFPTGDFTEMDLSELKKVDALSDYVIVKGVQRGGPGDFILVHEKDGAHGGEGRSCLFNDGHPEWLSEAEFQQRMTVQRTKMQSKE